MRFSSRKHIPAAVAALLVASPAFAADAVDTIPEPQPVFEPAPEVFSWSGGYFGATLGYGWADADLIADLGGTDSVDADGIVAGGFAGYNYQFANNVVLGAEASVDYFGVEDTVGGADIEGEYLATIGPRLGYAFDRALFYVEGGYARAGVDVDAGGGANDSADFDGYYAGVGMDYAVTDNVFAGLKYDYHDFGSEDVNFGAGDIEVDDFNAHTVKARVGFKF